jgi:hypothetical protein
LYNPATKCRHKVLLFLSKCTTVFVLLRHIRIKIIPGNHTVVLTWVYRILVNFIPRYCCNKILISHVKIHNTLCVPWIILYFVYQIIRLIIRSVAILTKKRTHIHNFLNQKKRILNHIYIIVNRWKMIQIPEFRFIIDRKSRRHSFIFWERSL